MKKQTLTMIAILTILSLALAACGNQPEATPAPAEIVSSSDVVAEGRLEPIQGCLLYTSPSPRDRTRSRMPSSA